MDDTNLGTRGEALRAFHREVDALVDELRRGRDPQAATATCEELADRFEDAPTGADSAGQAIEAGRIALARFERDGDLLLATGRLYLAAELLDAAYRALTDAVRVGAGGRAYRLLGETLLRLGDAQIARPMLKRAIAEGCSDPETAAWYEAARAYAAVQDSQGAPAVKRAVERAMRERAAAPKVPPAPRPPPKKRTGLSGAWRLGWLGSGVATSDAPPQSARRAPDVERSLPRFSFPGPETASTPSSTPAEPRTRTDAPVAIHVGSEDAVDFDLDREELDAVEILDPETAPVAASPPVGSHVPAPVPTAPIEVKPPRLVNDRLWEGDVVAQRPPLAPIPAPRRARSALRSAALVAVGLAAGFAIGRFAVRSAPPAELPAAAWAPESAAAPSCEAAPPPIATPAATTKATRPELDAPAPACPATNAMSTTDALLALSAIPAPHAFTAGVIATAVDVAISRRATMPIPAVPVRQPKPPAAPATTRRPR